VNRPLVRPLAIGAIAVAILFPGALLLEGQEPRSSVFTTEQAEAGRVAYAKHCASCHMPDLSGDNERPPLVGTSFMTTWGSRSTKEFLAYMTGAMPYGAPALDADTYAALTAYILQSNGASAGGQALNASTDVSIGSVSGKPQAPTISGRE
jgi:mono/diheme cytochrome c family protein